MTFPCQSVNAYIEGIFGIGVYLLCWSISFVFDDILPNVKPLASGYTNGNGNGPSTPRPSGLLLTPKVHP